MTSAIHSGTLAQNPAAGPDDGSAAGWRPRIATGVLVLANGEVIEGFGVGAAGSAVGEVCFNTAMTGYQEILTDPSYAAQIVTFTFPHIGIVGVNDEDIEVVNAAAASAAVGAIFRADLSEPSSFRARGRLDAWLKSRGVIGLTCVDTRALTSLIRSRGMPNAVIAHAPDGAFDLDALRAEAARWPGIDGMDLVPAVGATQRYDWDETSWTLEGGYGRRLETRFHVVAVDYGVKRNILEAPQRLRLLGDGRARDRERRGDSGASSRRRLPVERPGRSGRNRRIRRPDHQGAAWRPRSRSSASASAISSWGSRSARAR